MIIIIKSEKGVKMRDIKKRVRDPKLDIIRIFALICVVEFVTVLLSIRIRPM